jgi:hypothetical protein
MISFLEIYSRREEFISSLTNLGKSLTTFRILEMRQPSGILKREDKNIVPAFAIPSNEETREPLKYLIYEMVLLILL